MRKMSLQELIDTVAEAFEAMRYVCPHRYWNSNDCGYPDIDHKCVPCAPCNCPLLDGV